MTLEKTARTMAELITTGKIPPQFIGEKSYAVLKQEIFSLVNRYTPETMTEFEKTVFAKDVAATVEGILKFPPKGQADLFKRFRNTHEDDPEKDNSKKEEMDSVVNKIKNSIANLK